MRKLRFTNKAVEDLSDASAVLNDEARKLQEALQAFRY
mgnify:CR=1 FL=1